MSFEIRKVEVYQADCPHCHWTTTGNNREIVEWTMKYHLRDACPIVGRKWGP